MQRYVPVGASRLQFLQAPIHDQDAVAPVLKTLEQLRPDHVLLDRTQEEWDGWQRHRGFLDPFEKLVYDRLAPHHEVMPYVVCKKVHQWCIENRTPMGLILRSHAPPAKKALKKVRKRLQYDPTGQARSEYTMSDLYQDHLLQVPAMKAWLESRHERAAAALWKTYKGRKDRAACLFAYPEMDPVAQTVQSLAHS